jgi:RNA polymerase-associated protein
MALLLYEHPLSSYAQKVKIALREKGVPFAAELPESFGTGSRDGAFAQASPRGEVPALVDGDVTIFDSTVILEYVEDRWPEPPLLPKDPAGRARARMVEDVCDTQYEAINWGVGEILWFRRATGALADAMRAKAAQHTRAMQTWLSEKLGGAPWFGGDRFGWADAAVAPMVNRSAHYGLGPDAGGALAAWHARLRARPAVAQTFAEFDAAAARMAAASHHYTTGGRRRQYRDHRLDWMIRAGGLPIVEAGLRERNIRLSWPDADG